MKTVSLYYNFFLIMGQIEGITIERNTKRIAGYARIDLKKYGMILDIPNEETKKAMLEAQQNKTKGFNSINELLYDLKH
ncbi:hypothetical protein FACS189421_01970 [Bacteroidia bacterium]|nr:hypothetical protein FACS189421_01970 [Bacteroidia bacterium]GHT48197.1 hypothetical protein FACS189440_11150 [Bacteroidia bacterium]